MINNIVLVSGVQQIYQFFFKFFYLKTNDRNELTYKNRKRLTDSENELMVAGGEGMVTERDSQT